MSHEHARRTFVTSVDLLRYALDALENNPDEMPSEQGHPLDVYSDARIALDTVTGLLIAETNKAYRQP